MNITAYQYSPSNKKYVGEYIFPNNMDKKDIHLPPYTTLEQPPSFGANKECYMGINGWEIHDSTSELNAVIKPNDYSMMEPWYIAKLKLDGHWELSDDTKLKDDTAKKNYQYSLTLIGR